MAIKWLFSVRDRAADTYFPPFAVPAVGVALRDFADQVNNKDSPMSAHPDDFELWLLGTLDDRSGEIECSLEMKGVAKDFVRAVTA